MNERVREHPEFAVCGLNCGLCPRYHTVGSSRCPGCEGPGFYEKHPPCGVISCSKRHGGVEFCYQCLAYPCERFSSAGEKDSFISYRTVLGDFEAAASGGLDVYLQNLRRRMELLEHLIENFDDGRRKSFYCTAANLLPLEDLEDVTVHLRQAEGDTGLEKKKRALLAVRLLNEKAEGRGIVLGLRR